MGTANVACRSTLDRAHGLVPTMCLRKVSTMNNQIGQLSCLYFPFSRTVDQDSLKLFLLVFDSIAFIDEAEGEEWRRYLLRTMAKKDSPIFDSYERFADDFQLLIDERLVTIVEPNCLKASRSASVAMATLADLADQEIIRLASQPGKYGLPARSLRYYDSSSNDRPTWHAFMGKLSHHLLCDPIYAEDPLWSSHVLVPGSHVAPWTLSYEAGSSAITNFYLESSEELGLTPITNSILHHELVVKKLKRILASEDRLTDFIDSNSRRKLRSVLGKSEIVRLLGELYPSQMLSKLTFDQILKFRNETALHRRAFACDIDYTLRTIDSDITRRTYEAEVAKCLRDLQKQARELQTRLASIRNKMFPAFAESVLYGTAGGGALSAAATFVGGLSPAGVVAASAITATGAFFIKALEIWRQYRDSKTIENSSVLYLSSISGIFNT